jgi:hypothetical protein
MQSNSSCRVYFDHLQRETRNVNKVDSPDFFDSTITNREEITRDLPQREKGDRAGEDLVKSHCRPARTNTSIQPMISSEIDIQRENCCISCQSEA